MPQFQTPGFGQLIPQQPLPGAEGFARPTPQARTPAQDVVGDRTNRWEAFFARPEVVAALTQFGTSLLSPNRSVGQAFGDAVGAVGRVQQQDQQQQVIQQEQDRADRRVDAEERRVGVAEGNLEVQRQQIQNSARRIGLDEAQLRMLQSRLNFDIAQAQNAQELAPYARLVDIFRTALPQAVASNDISANPLPFDQVLNQVYSAVAPIAGIPAPELSDAEIAQAFSIAGPGALAQIQSGNFGPDTIARAQSFASRAGQGGAEAAAPEAPFPGANAGLPGQSAAPQQQAVFTNLAPNASQQALRNRLATVNSINEITPDDLRLAQSNSAIRSALVRKFGRSVVDRALGQ